MASSIHSSQGMSFTQVIFLIIGTTLTWSGFAKNSKKKETHWAFQTVVLPKPPQMTKEEGSRNPIERFIFTGFETKGLKPNPDTRREHLLRHRHLNLIGIDHKKQPPSTKVRTKGRRKWTVSPS